MKTPGQVWVTRRIKDLVSAVERSTNLIKVGEHKNFTEYGFEVYDLALDIIGIETNIDFESDNFWNIYDSIISAMEDIFNDQLRHYYNNNKTEETLNESFDRILDLYTKKKEGVDLKPSEQTMMRAFQNFVNKGGEAEEFVYSDEEDYDVDEREGEKFEYNGFSMPLVYTFSEEFEEDDEINYFGEILFEDDEFLGVITTDKRGYITGYDFYSVLDENVRLQLSLIHI